MSTQEYYYIEFHSFCVSVNKKYVNYEVEKIVDVINSLHESCSSDDTEF